jgi:pyruvate formate-lyase activating enzyme-like uncharacterized protein
MVENKVLLGQRDIALSTTNKFATGCTLCFGGAKSIIFVTGLCKENCYYCPVNRELLHRDVIKVNEKFVNSVEEVPSEIARSNSKGASVTGGDPLAAPRKTIEVINLLKSVFGSGFHIHLYTTGRDLTMELLRSLDRAGLDEIRFHPLSRDYLRKIEITAKHSSIDFGVEIPSIPGTENWILEIASFLQRIGGKFLNLNELEVSPGNYYQLISRGFKVNPGTITVKGSLETAINSMKKAIELGIDIPIHFCPAVYKDKFQTRLRFIQTIKNNSEIYEETTMDGTLKTIIIEIHENHICKEKINKLIGYYVFQKFNKLYIHPSDYDLVKIGMKECIKNARLIETHPNLHRTVINETDVLENR